ncbi:S8 family serine peptidase, partial [Nocardioides sp.]|uniref:S8 family serine peptidase n=1 Tax=Nocardioides sp. TaxID=35761 RepID=UPI0035615663
MNGRGCVVTTLGLVLLLPASLVNGDGAHANGTERRGPKTTTVVVTMRDQSALEGRHIKNRKARQRAVITDLLATATAGQASLRRDLDRWRRLGTVVDYEPLWVVDAVTVTATVEVVAAIAARPDVAEVAPDAIEIVPSLAPGTINQATIGAPEVWALGSSGQGVVVATLDSGADLSHPDLESRWRGGSNSWFDPYGQHPSSPVDLSGHGTATLGVLVGGDVSGSTLGTAPGAKWVSARIWDDAGRSTTSAIHRAFQWLLDPDGDPRTNDAPRVVNGSWSVGSTPGCDEVFRPDVQALVAAGISPVFAAGNFGTAAGSGASPANYPESIAVGAVRTDGLSVLPSSSRGPTSCGGPERVFPDVVAPGESIVTTERFGQYQSLSGTSVAAPHVAGTLALMVAAHPSLTPAQQRASVLSSALDLGATGPDDTFGLGRVSASAAYAASASPPDLALSVEPSLVSANPGDRVVFDVTTQAQNGFEGAVQLSAESHGGLGLDLSADSFGQGSGQATLTVSVPTGATSGDHRITVVASSAGQTWSSTATVAV